MLFTVLYEERYCCNYEPCCRGYQECSLCHWSLQVWWLFNIKKCLKICDGVSDLKITSQAIKANGQLFVSGCIGLDAETGDFTAQDVEGQAEKVKDCFCSICINLIYYLRIAPYISFSTYTYINIISLSLHYHLINWVQVMENMKAILEAGGSSFEQVVKTTILLRDINDFQKVNTIYGKCTFSFLLLLSLVYNLLNNICRFQSRSPCKSHLCSFWTPQKCNLLSSTLYS